MQTTPISLRVKPEVKRQLEQMARRFGTNASTLAADYLTQGVRMAAHPAIEFRQTPIGRIAYVRGVRLPVWMAIDTIADCDNNVPKAARLLQLPMLLLGAALKYAKSFPHEIAAEREAGHENLDDLDRLVPNHSSLRV